MRVKQTQFAIHKQGTMSGSSQSHRFPLPFTALQSTISLSLDVSGVPALTVGPDNQVYFAASMKGYALTNQFLPYSVTTSTLTSDFKYNIIVGNYTSTGSPTPPLGLFLTVYSFYNSAMIDDSTTLLNSNTGRGVNTLWSGADDSQPSIAAGSSNEIYIAYVTTGSVYNRYNMATVPTFCGCVNPGPTDVVVARILNVNKIPEVSQQASFPRVTYAQWRIQDATINSCNDETNPHLAIDTVNQFLYMVHQTSGQILCFPVIGSAPNIILSCLQLGTGAVVWREAQGQLNAATGQTKNPAIAVDGRGGICVAAEVTGAIQGGADLSGAVQRVDVVKFTQITTSPGVFSSEYRQWILSGLPGGDLWPGAGKTCREPTIACAPTGQILLAFVTDGVLPDQIRSVTGSNTDLVVVFIQADGSGVIVHQGGLWNSVETRYLSARTPYATADPYGNFYLSVNVVTAEGDNVLVYKLRYGDSASEWGYTVGASTLGAYAIAGNDRPNSMFPTDTPSYPVAAQYSQTPVAAGRTALATATVTNNVQDVTQQEAGMGGSNGLAVGFYREALYYLNDTAFNYMAVTKSICACGKTNCGGC
jgi:hypothetical protein